MARHVELFAVCPPGLEPVVAAELRAAGFRSIREDKGGVTFKGHVGRANRVLACPTRILQRVTRFPARSFEEFETQFRALDLSAFGGVTPKVSARRSRLYHTGALEERIAEWTPSGPTTLHVRVVRDRCTLSVDTSGERLHRRGWRLEMGRAPLRETLAASLLRAAGWTPGTALVDPMCGSGTFLIEAARHALGLPPGQNRTFACDRWSGPGRQDIHQAVETTFVGGDLERSVLDSALRNAERAHVAGTVHDGPPPATGTTAHTDHPSRVVALDLYHCAARDLEPPSPTGLIIANPPYGERVQKTDAFEELGSLLATKFRAWRAAVLCPSPNAYKALGRRSESSLRITNGGIKLDFHVLPPADPV